MSVGATVLNGTPTCANLAGWLGALLSLGYDVTFAGDTTYVAARAHGRPV